jgi:hypothetical protein
MGTAAEHHVVPAHPPNPLRHHADLRKAVTHYAGQLAQDIDAGRRRAVSGVGLRLPATRSRSSSQQRPVPDKLIQVHSHDHALPAGPRLTIESAGKVPGMARAGTFWTMAH